MGLFEDAIGEFRYALGSGARVSMRSMMGLCALDAGRATVPWASRAGARFARAA
jgi:hypothetical protein